MPSTRLTRALTFSVTSALLVTAGCDRLPLQEPISVNSGPIEEDPPDAGAETPPVPIPTNPGPVTTPPLPTEPPPRPTPNVAPIPQHAPPAAPREGTP